MKHMSLAARYRPRTFAEVIGQDLATAAFSRAAAEDRVAPAYLLSGTRGVGKTTIARIFAKALNCENSPAPEPCNICGQCQRITAGSHVDVNEIDGASNTGVDDVRALRENMGYMPMEGRYKIFIVDEAHMLSKNAFNALLKTLEEPPPRTVFIFATTEAHRFPSTIVSRCQHFVFRHLPEDLIFSHLLRILDKEQIPHDEAAVRMIARRAAGSARDSLSLLDQVLAMGSGKLDEPLTREALGLAGEEFFSELFPALKERSCQKVLELCGQLLQSGVDIGFFVRELADNFKKLFLYRQAGKDILLASGISANEEAFLSRHARLFGVSHLHAAWQMTLESQRSITQSLEPGAALELLLVNLALLPQLIPVGNVWSADPGDPPGGEMSPAQEVQKSPPASPQKPNIQPVLANTESSRELKTGEKTVSAAQKPYEENWEAFLDFCHKMRESGEETISRDILRQLKPKWENGILELAIPTSTLAERLEKRKPLLLSAMAKYCGEKVPEIKFVLPPPPRSGKEMLEEYAQKPELQLCSRILGARITNVTELDGKDSA